MKVTTKRHTTKKKSYFVFYGFIGFGFNLHSQVFLNSVINQSVFFPFKIKYILKLFKDFKEFNFMF